VDKQAVLHNNYYICLMTIDLRSDTVTKPSPDMLEAMFKAPVGDDVFGEDPTMAKLEKMVTDMFGMEAALFCPSGSMTNQIAVKCHTQPSDEVICDKLSHVYIYEGGGIASNSACQIKALDGNLGRLKAEQVLEAINPDDIHRARTSLVCLENTANRGGGTCYKFSDIQSIKDVCSNNNLKFHLDGARIWNAMIVTGETPKQYGAIFDSISVCLSKGLGAPVGSVLLGNKAFIHQAKRVRKVFGGGMRQVGYLAAAGIYGLEHNISRLKDDHLHTKQITDALQQKDFIGEIIPPETNILIFEVKGKYDPKSFVGYLQKHSILCFPISATQVRMVTHLDVTSEMVKTLIGIIQAM
jgi:threonine aldolase